VPIPTPNRSDSAAPRTLALTALAMLACAATVQLSVPVIAALGGLLLMTKTVTLRLLLASCATLGGIAVVLTQRGARA
jgi:hypothetical protein